MRFGGGGERRLTIDSVDLDNVLRHGPRLLGKAPVQRDCVCGDAVQRDARRGGQIEAEKLHEGRYGDLEQRRCSVAHPILPSVWFHRR